MQEMTTPVVVEPGAASASATFPTSTRPPSDRGRLPVRNGTGWTDVTTTAFAAEVRELAKGMLAAGLRPGDAVGLMSKTRYEWTLCDFALWAAGAVPVPIYETSSPDQVQWILEDSGAVGIIVETTAHRRGREGPRPAAGPASTSGASTPATSTSCAPGRARSPTSARRGPQPGDPGQRGDDHLHLGNHRPPQGRASSPTATSSTRPRTPPQARGRRRAARRLDPAVPPARPRLRPVHRGPVRRVRRRRWATPPTSRTCSPTSPRSGRRSSWRCRASSRRSTTPARPRPRPRGRAGSSRRRGTAIAYSESLDAGGPPLGLRLRHASSTGSSTASSGRRWAGGSSTPSPAAPRSGPGSGTSSAGSA